MAQDSVNATDGVGVDNAKVMWANGRWVQVGSDKTTIKAHVIFKGEWYTAKPEGLFILSKDGWLNMAQTFQDAKQVEFLDVGEEYLKYKVDDRIYELASSDGVATITRL